MCIIYYVYLCAFKIIKILENIMNNINDYQY